MPSDYAAIRRDHAGDYGRKVGKYGKTFAEMYGQRAHFIEELLQNAEDALRTRGPSGSRSGVDLVLSEHTLLFRHYGRPFTEADVRSICAIGESTKDETAIGRFGIGFKSVFAFTGAPEVHSGTEAFRIEDFVLPFRADPVERDDDETVFLLPLSDPSSVPEIETGFRDLGPRVLLFLRHIDAIQWTGSDGAEGTYVRHTEHLNDSNSPHVRKVTILGESSHEQNIEEGWLLFSRRIPLDDGGSRFVEIAFSLEDDRIVPAPHSPLVVFFPTVVETHLGFLVQGPYRTTTSRDSVLSRDPWNQHCVAETGHLLADSLEWLRDSGRLDVDVLRSLPIDRTKFDDANMFAPLYDLTKRTLSTTPLLPTSEGTHTSAATARIARTKRLRTLLSPSQLTRLFQSHHPQSWLTPEVSLGRTPELHKYLTDDLGVPEMTPRTFLRDLDPSFLEGQNHDWIRTLYEFLLPIPDLWERAIDLPLIRLSTGEQVVPFAARQPQAYLPGDEKTGFPTVHPETCRSPEARKFLLGIGLSVPDPVDDVIRHVLSKYSDEIEEIDDSDYGRDVDRILSASRTDSAEQQRKLRAALRGSLFVAARDAKTGEPCYRRPGSLYFRTEALGRLFDGIDDVEFVDEACACLRREDVRRLLRECGVASGLRVVSAPSDYDREELRQIRQNAGLERDSWGRTPSGRGLLGLDGLLKYLPNLRAEERRSRARTLWEMLADMARTNQDAFSVEYTWGYSHESRSVRLNAAFVRKLNGAAWVPDDRDELWPPSSISFASLGWREDPFLVSKIRFRPEAVEELAEKAEVDLELLQLLQLLKAKGIDSAGVRRELLGLLQPVDFPEPGASTAVDGASESETEGEGMSSGGTSRHQPSSAKATGDRGAPHRTDESASEEEREGRRSRSAASAGAPEKRPHSGTSGGRAHFHSYVSVSPEDEERDDRGGSRHEDRRELEEKAIALILAHEPAWHRTAIGNPGFDLFRTHDGSPGGEETVWCEIKAMSGTLDRNPVGLSRTQFEFARQHGDAFWLYIVERAGQNDARILRIQDPARRARTFTFDRGWRQVAETEPSE